jgi:hypothetical protein
MALLQRDRLESAEACGEAIRSIAHRSVRAESQASTLARADPLLLTESDPASAHGLVVSWPAQRITGMLSGNYSFVRSQGPFLRPDLGSAGHGVRRRSMMILVANSSVEPDQATICRAANCEMRVLAEGVSLCHSATLTRLTATAVMTCCKRVFANPI